MSGDGFSRIAKTEQDAESCIETPLWLVERIREVLGGGISLDPCTTPENPVGASRFYTPADDGILQPWLGYETIFMNPPYGRTIKAWIQKALIAASNGSKVVILAPGRVGTVWFNSAWLNATDALFFNGRIQFKNQPDPAKFPSVLFSYNVSLEPMRDLGVRAVAA